MAAPPARPALSAERLRAIALLAMAIALPTAAQDAVPSDVELRTAYCIPIVKSMAKVAHDTRAAINDWWQQNPPTPEFQQRYAESDERLRKNEADLDSTLNRLQSYLFPRMEHRDSIALMLAFRRGEADVREAQESGERCAKKCGITAYTPWADEKTRACSDECTATNKELTARTKPCLAPTWLPF
jgi:hypothetical protein